jgi:hypothetical protein
MAKLGTKQRPAIVRVRTEARAKEVASVFNEHGWQFILGIEPDKPENISDLKHLLKTQKYTQTKKMDGRTASVTSLKPRSQRKTNPPITTAHSRAQKTRRSSRAKKVSDEKYEYAAKTNLAILPAIITGALSTFFLIKFLTTMSLWYLILLVVPSIFFLLCINILILNQKVILQDRTITILRRTRKSMTANISDTLYQITKRNGEMYKFRFKFDGGQRIVDLTPKVYKNGDKLLQQITDIINQENVNAEIIEQEKTSERHTMAERLQRRKIARIIKKHRDKNLVMGVTWYRPEQWELLQEVVEDKEHFDMTYEESVVDSENKIKKLEAQGYRPVRVEVDVEEMLTWCSDHDLSVTPENRTKFMMTKLKELVNQGIVEP